MLVSLIVVHEYFGFFFRKSFEVFKTKKTPSPTKVPLTDSFTNFSNY